MPTSFLPLRLTLSPQGPFCPVQQPNQPHQSWGVEAVFQLLGVHGGHGAVLVNWAVTDGSPHHHPGASPLTLAEVEVEPLSDAGQAQGHGGLGLGQGHTREAVLHVHPLAARHGLGPRPQAQ